MHTEGHNMDHDDKGHSRPPQQVDSDQPGYELEDVNVKGISVFLAGLFGVVIIFFLFCYVAGQMINKLWIEKDGPATKWSLAAGAVPPGGKRQDLKSNAAIEQQELQQITSAFPEPRLDIDDGNQATADLHAREDLLLNNYSLVDGQPGAIRIPIDRAMELIAQRGLPVETPATATPDSVAHAARPEIPAPLTTGFARTGFELTTIAAREQKMNYGKAEAATQASLAPDK